MAIKRINQIYFLADTAEDLALIPNVRQGYEAYVISEGCEYKATSEAEWFKQASEGGETPEVDLSGYVTKEEMKSAIDAIVEASLVKDLEKYEFSNLPEGSLISRRDKEIRIMCPANATYHEQNVGEGGNPNMYYMTFTTYAPEGAVTFKEGDKGVLVDEILNFETTAGTGVDKYGRKYKKHWFALAMKNDAGEWTYFGANSSTSKYIGWSYVVEWYDAEGKVIDNDIIRINLSNEDCHLKLASYLG